MEREKNFLEQLNPNEVAVQNMSIYLVMLQKKKEFGLQKERDDFN
jgi:hypothetical protein